ncbi:hypothetical protein G6F43_011524 [Rhizopus delemar]|nr:hypothetical protein G6F43_011524 [Rhizopus delemar]
MSKINNKVERISSHYDQLESLNDQFRVKQQTYSQQYASIYYLRLIKLREAISKASKERWSGLSEVPRYVEKVLNTQPGELCYMVGTIYLQMNKKPNVLNDLEDEETIVRPDTPAKYRSDEDVISLEDESGRVEITGACLSKQFLVTGMIVGILGKEVATGTFEVIDICLPGVPPQKPLTTLQETPKYVALLSGLNIGEAHSDMRRQLLLEFLTGELEGEQSSSITRVILAGNSIIKPKKAKNNEGPVDDFLEELCSTVDVDIMPGATDPSQSHLPQQRMHPSMFKQAHKLSTLNSVSNPYWCEIENITFLGTSGQNIDDIYRYVDSEDRLQMAESCMYWRHMAPSAPDTLWSYPFKDRDPFIIEQCPHVYFVGNQPEFEDNLLLGPDGQQIRVILLPSFAETGSCRIRTFTTIRQRSLHGSSIKRQQQRNTFERIADSWNKTKIKWYPIPVGLGLSVIGVIQYRHIKEREEKETTDKPKYRATGPWQVHVAAALPLRTMSRIWGAFNSLTIPTPLRPAGFKLYSWIFGCNLDEMKNPNLYDYPNLSAFFYRELKDDARPIARDAPLVSPSDGKVLHFGLVQGRDIEQIKGITYNLDALLGNGETSILPVTNAVLGNSDNIVVDENEFANVNGIPYSLDDMLAEGTDHHAVKTQSVVGEDAVAEGHEARPKDERALSKLAHVDSSTNIKPGHALYFCVVYLAPGDYHRFHSPTNWVVETRRHFAGELFSVSPYFVKLLQNLFVLNERVALLGKWKHGFFSMIPVGATNVGSIKINFDEALKTNKKEDIPLGTYTEVTYKSASKLLGGKPLRYGDEMGGFYLGSTVVLVFEAPQSFKFCVTQGQKVKMGEPLGKYE